LDFESGDQYIFSMFEAVVDVVHGTKSKKLQFAKCPKCGSLTPFIPKSKRMQFTSMRCNNCGSVIAFGVRGMNSHIGELAEIFCENCEDDCRKCPINKLANELSRVKRTDLDKKSALSTS
jgi:predicted RNA-binding Zn-ribbon protein involved in translation (DUF1610 family)